MLPQQQEHGICLYYPEYFETYACESVDVVYDVQLRTKVSLPLHLIKIQLTTALSLSLYMSVALPTEYLLLDLEVSSGGEIYDIGVVRGEESVNYQSGSKAHLNALAEFGVGAKAVVGHNLISHDLEILKACGPENKVLQLPVIDTLLLSPYVFLVLTTVDKGL